MSLQRSHPITTAPGAVSPERSDWLRKYFPRIDDRRFWAVQGLVLVVAAMHYAVEIWQVGNTPLAGEQNLCFIPVAMFFLPVVYAALNFGFEGSVSTAMWCTAVSIFNLILFHHGLELAEEALQIGIIDVVAFFVGQRVDRELAARRAAEAFGAALAASEVRYRGLFESSPIAILVLDSGGGVLESNPIAQVLFGVQPGKLRGMALADLLGTALTDRLLDSQKDGAWQEESLVLRRKDGTETYLRPTLTRTTDSQGNPITLVLLADSTTEHFRQAGLRAYAAHVLLVQEEERRRIAQELHDDTVQKLILLCRRLDLAEGSDGNLPATTVHGLGEARNLAEEVVAGLRNFARALRPPMLDDLGLVTSIRRLLVDLGERVGIEGQLRVAGAERRLPQNIEVALFRITQEALRNIERHSKATEVAVRVAFAQRGVRLVVIDNGIGFTVPARQDFAASAHLGLLGMRERSESLAGRLKIRSSVGQGTVLTVSIPD